MGKIENNNWKKNTALFLISQAITLFGSAVVQFAIIWYIAKETDSGIMVTVSTICGFLPQILISLPGGVWADRYNRKILIVLSDGMIAISTLILAILFFVGHGSVVLLLVTSAIRSLGAGVQMPAVGAFIPQFVPEDKLMKVNGINGSIQSGIFLLAPAASGAVLTFGAIEYILSIDVVTAVIGISILLMLKVSPMKKKEDHEKTHYLTDLKEGISYTFTHSFLRKLLSYYCVLYFLAVPAAFLNVLMVTRTFGGEYWKLTANEMAFFIGSMAGGILIASWGGFKSRTKTFMFGCFLFGIMTFVVGFVHLFPLYLAIMVITGISMPFFSSPVMVLIQEKVESQIQGRVFSMLQIIGSATMPIGMAVFGPLSDVIKIQTIMIISGAAMALFSIIMLLDRKFINQGMPKEQPENVEINEGLE